MITILVVDDHPVVREGVSAMLATQPDLKVLSETGSGREAVRLALQQRPDVILMDLQLPDLDGADAIAQIKAAWPAAKFLVLTAYDTDERILHAVRAGAQGYLLKGVPKEQLFQAVRAINEGGTLLGPGVAPKLLSQVSGLAGNGGVASPNRLSERELAILRLVSEGNRNKEIASELSISERTVKFHLNTIFQKLGASSRTEAVKLAVQQGLIRI